MWNEEQRAQSVVFNRTRRSRKPSLICFWWYAVRSREKRDPSYFTLKPSQHGRPDPIPILKDRLMMSASPLSIELLRRSATIAARMRRTSIGAPSPTNGSDRATAAIIRKWSSTRQTVLGAFIGGAQIQAIIQTCAQLLSRLFCFCRVFGFYDLFRARWTISAGTCTRPGFCFESKLGLKA